MMLGSVSKERKAAILAGQICYTCGKQKATVPDGIGGKLCQDCAEGLQAMRLRYDMAGGFRKAVKRT